ncbi:MAG: transcriptional regulator [Peptococcaceae bacterium BICA1-7]|nr:MAG: transcriptional regulator [Peptococcaceae bacterium BICA1-7]HBV98260.1 transcriptional regulator [Desulfotomaculum sp.]
MSNISDLIEKYLRDLILSSNRGQVDIQRNMLAEKFDCVPSQINYVLTTRFTVERGFVVESRRGGGGFVRIIKLPFDEKVDTVSFLCDLIGRDVSQQAADGVVSRLLEEGILSERESAIMKAAVGRDVLRIALPARDQLRALILKSMIISILQYGKEED